MLMCQEQTTSWQLRPRAGQVSSVPLELLRLEYFLLKLVHRCPKLKGTTDTLHTVNRSASSMSNKDPIGLICNPSLGRIICSARKKVSRPQPCS